MNLVFSRLFSVLMYREYSRASKFLSMPLERVAGKPKQIIDLLPFLLFLIKCGVYSLILLGLNCRRGFILETRRCGASLCLSNGCSFSVIYFSSQFFRCCCCFFLCFFNLVEPLLLPGSTYPLHLIFINSTTTQTTVYRSWAFVSFAQDSC
jgi:hypothetical protein